jgi:hypothetical protein
VASTEPQRHAGRKTDHTGIRLPPSLIASATSTIRPLEAVRQFLPLERSFVMFRGMETFHQACRRGLLIVAGVLLSVTAVAAVDHPYILWTRDDAILLKKIVETSDWAKQRYETMGKESFGKGKLETTFRNLFAFSVMGDISAGETERKALLAFANENPEGKSRYYSPYQEALRYDALHAILTPEERKRVETAFGRFIDYHLHKDKFVYSREAFLPNMQWNRVMGTHLMAVALGDENLIRAMADSNGGWKWYMDSYVADGAFYFEEFAKQCSMMTEMMLWCRGLERLGLNELGFGYVGKGGATMRSYMESVMRLGYPRAGSVLPRPPYYRVTMGDAGDIHAIVSGYETDGKGGNPTWTSKKMNGSVPRMLEPLWFEFAHAKWPDAGFDYFLAQMRPPDADRYYPSLFFLGEPVDPAKVKKPPAESYVAHERGFAMLRAEGSPAYWESKAPVAAFQFATYYMHYTSDCFSILQFVANNRVLYRRRGVSRGYAGGCPWTDSVRSNTGVVVDSLRARAVGRVPVRHSFDPLIKFTAAHGKPITPYPPAPAEDSTADFHQKGCYRAMARSMGSEVYPGVDLERALFLTREYLFDIYRLAAASARDYHWQVQVMGAPVLDPQSQWKPTDELSGKLLKPEVQDTIDQLAKEPACYDLKNVRRRDTGTEGFRVMFRQDSTNTPAGQGGGVCVHMPAGETTTLFSGNIADAGHTTFIAARRLPSTVFLAVHEPYEKDSPRIAQVRTMASTTQAVAVAVAGAGVDDRIMYRYFAGYTEPVTIESEGERFAFADHAFVRVSEGRVEISGNLRSCAVKVRGRPILILNGKEHPARVENGLLVF